MNIVYISQLDGRPWAGPTYSVPNQIKSQSQIDNVFWFNYFDNSKPEWISKEWKELAYYHDLNEYPDVSISEFPKPFDKPDLIILEQFYCHAKTKIPQELMRHNIPYIIVPRAEMTKTAQSHHALKKWIFNCLYYRRFAQRARAIQYLTDEERIESTEKWNKHSIVIPNGTIIPRKKKTSFSTDKTICTVIGRIEPFQKGLDILIGACVDIADILRTSNYKINIYGPDRVNRLGELREEIYKKGISDIISFYDPVYGDEKENVLLNSDIFIIPSRFEGHPTALIEALSYGLPVIATTGSNMRSEIESFEAGWGADNTIQSLQRALVDSLEQRASFYKKGENARRLSYHYAWESIAQESKKKYTQLLAY